MLPKKKEFQQQQQQQVEPYALEDMISDLQARRRSSLDHEETLQDPSELLRQRERDLVLAAELGKALLERNQELTRQSELLADEYAAKLEIQWNIFISYQIDSELVGIIFEVNLSPLDSLPPPFVLYSPHQMAS
uniref:Uncharacterized protein n=1 Tax=Vespula pensylvanica TaxID=30213 RepID=A0A834MX08_VESPE|nr:hypothetical protein H0235_018372 [Vespula pensylvanica]